jgi:hypothetical protein
MQTSTQASTTKSAIMSSARPVMPILLNVLNMSSSMKPPASILSGLASLMPTSPISIKPPQNMSLLPNVIGSMQTSTQASTTKSAIIQGKCFYIKTDFFGA